jgi:hypothetical protein
MEKATNERGKRVLRGGAEEGSKDRNSRRRGKKRKISDGRRYKCYGEGENAIILEKRVKRKNE